MSRAFPRGGAGGAGADAGLPRPGGRIRHPDLGEGVVLEAGPDGFVTAFFLGHGERRVPAESLRAEADGLQRLAACLAPAGEASLRRWRLILEAAELPLAEGASSLVAARIDLLPH